MQAIIAILAGDGIGPEVTTEAVRVLDAVAARFNHSFVYLNAKIGGAAIDAVGNPLPTETLETCRRADAILLGAVGGPRWDRLAQHLRPEQGLLRLRKTLALYGNLRPVRTHAPLVDRSPIRAERLRGCDLLLVRELTGGIYFGERTEGRAQASDRCSYTAHEVERVVRLACRLAASRKGRLTSVDKANVLATSRLWRAVVDDIVTREFPNICVEHLLVDAAAMYLIQEPSRFDVVVTENMFGDILSDEASVLTGSMGMLPSASIGEAGVGLYEPIHGSAPNLAGRGVANPYGAILSAAMMLETSLQLPAEAQAVATAVEHALQSGVLTADLCSSPRSNASASSTPPASTEAAGRFVAEAILGDASVDRPSDDGVALHPAT